jgi:hypothetical protein
MIRTDLRPLINLTLRFVVQSRPLIEHPKRVIDKMQKIVDDQTAKIFEEHSAKRSRK